MFNFALFFSRIEKGSKFLPDKTRSSGIVLLLSKRPRKKFSKKKWIAVGFFPAKSTKSSKSGSPLRCLLKRKKCSFHIFLAFSMTMDNKKSGSDKPRLLQSGQFPPNLLSRIFSAERQSAARNLM
ncbi:hypothetical protein Y032_0331g2738 [Ancylostoma ceylanicum]|uniref:Uncharacterized protein n=1 Tax=Ancylostoma ceylanicum TaxID=53326 RepID=A0A016RZB9_9BILA|nr:hypothetical protein Y032_0331g2738 [Ancylostoma ceylanicum]